MDRRKLIAGNWKMNGLRTGAVDLADRLVDKYAEQGDIEADLLVCPPFTLLDRIGQQLAGSKILLGAQDCHTERSGAYTGDVSAVMAKDLGASYVIVGHSERRTLHHESSDLVRAKADAVLAAGLAAIVCLGESEPERRAGRAVEVVRRQLADSLPGGATPQTLVIAYEPIWAIGSGRVPDADEVVEIHAALRQGLHDLMGSPASGVRLLYGGSVKPSNAKEFLTLPDVDGCLVGGASLNADEFWAIALASRKLAA